MKTALKTLGITVMGLLVATVIYPLLHELGHIITSVLVGAEVVDMALLPVPSILCDVIGINNLGLVVIGFGGMVFPVLISFFLPRRWFFVWYLRMLLQVVSILAIIISCVSVILMVNPQDDMIQVLKFWEYGKILLLFILCCLASAVAMLVYFDRPMRRIRNFFEI